ncbi:MAG: Wzy polymerase domain-containing protein [Gallionella sp.]
MLNSVPLNGARWWGYAVLSVLAIPSLLEYPLWYAYFLAIAAFLLGALDETRYGMRLSNMGRVMMFIILLLGLALLFQLKSGYQQLKIVLVISPASGQVAESFKRSRDTLAVMHAMPLLMPYSELFMSALVTVDADQLAAKRALNTRVLHFMPTGTVGYRQALLLAQSGRLEQAKKMWKQTVWSYPDNAAERKLLRNLTEKDPAHFAALLEFAFESEQEYVRAIHNK